LPTTAQEFGKKGKGFFIRPDKVVPEGTEEAVVIKGRAFAKLVRISF
jgi:hypothetical protein